MAQDWMADVRKYVPQADEGHVGGIVRHCGIALHKPDSAMVSMSDPKETARVREGFCKKKLGLTHSDAELDSAIAEIGQRMKDDRTKNRVTVYYLLAERFEKLGLFEKAVGSKAAITSIAPAAGATATLGAIGAGGAAIANKATVPLPATPPAAPAPPVAPVSPPTAPATMAATPAATLSSGGEPTAGAFDWRRPEKRRFLGSVGDGEHRGGAMTWLALLAIGVILLLFWLVSHRGGEQAAATPNAMPGTTSTATQTVATKTATTASSAIPAGAGVVSETRADKPAVNVYFDTGKSDVAPTFSAAAATLKSYLGANAGAKLAVSGFNDKTGNAAANAKLSKNRAKAVQAALVAAGIPASSIELAKPSDTTDTATSNEGARRVEVTVK